MVTLISKSNFRLVQVPVRFSLDLLRFSSGQITFSSGLDPLKNQICTSFNSGSDRFYLIKLINHWIFDPIVNESPL